MTNHDADIRIAELFFPVVIGKPGDYRLSLGFLHHAASAYCAEEDAEPFYAESLIYSAMSFLHKDVLAMATALLDAGGKDVERISEAILSCFTETSLAGREVHDGSLDR